MEKYIDLHTHSTYSEGILGCRQLLQSARKYQIKVLALTDHNVIDGVPEIMELGKQLKIKVVSGVEIYTQYRGEELHLLGYNFKLGDTVLARSLKKLQKNHIRQVQKSITNLKKEGFIIDEEKIFQNFSKQLGVIHILEEIERHPKNRNKIKKEIPPRYDNFFGKVYYYMGKNKPGYFKLSKLPILEAIDMIKKAGGIAVLAHPGQQLTFDQDNLIHDLEKKGLSGLEVLSPYHNWRQIEHYQRIAEENKLVITGGSDFHRPLKGLKKGLIKIHWDYLKVPYRIYNNLRKIL